MASPARVNPLIDLLEDDKPIFCLWVNYYGVGTDYQAATAIQANPNYDFILYDLEHQPYNLDQLRGFLQDLLDPATIEANGRRAIKPVIPRLPAAGRELNQWVIKQVLDTGVAGLMFPHIETAEEALHAVAAARYAQRPDAADFEPEGKRGYSPAVPARYWGLNQFEYELKSDIWGLDPDGNLLLIFIIESYRGVENVREIAKALTDAGVKAILWAGGGDLALSYGEPVYGGDAPRTDAGIDAILAAGKEFGLPVGMNGYLDAQSDFDKGARAFFTVGPASLGVAPLSEEARKALGR
ncbi:aldolase/citrate lyase family protein [Subtercola endophyticus]|uniref:aldolase/citrate lyase family protein n=1 Tax=Subtercola endophyticus TaxID=2895559 RepID=UPI001E6306B2|nr:aldolase/citrate lyase family protein [Subtercola endophyticus]UFS58737.1 aldolase/citrate lyase family protein [Subtercola endophyticus]